MVSLFLQRPLVGLFFTPLRRWGAVGAILVVVGSFAGSYAEAKSFGRVSTTPKAPDPTVSLGDVRDTLWDLLPPVAPPNDEEPVDATPDATGASSDKPGKTSSFSFPSLFGLGDSSPPAQREPTAQAPAPNASTPTPEGMARVSRHDAPPQPEGDKPYTVYRAPMIGGDSGNNVRVVPSRAGLQTVRPTLEAATVPSVPYESPLPTSTVGPQFFPVFSDGEEAKPQLVPVASTTPLEANHTAVRTAIIALPDRTREATASLALFMTLARAKGSADQTFVLAPQFPVAVDLAPLAAYLPEGGRAVARWPLNPPSGGWWVGGESLPIDSLRGSVSSFTVLDLLLMYLADTRRFPNVREVLIVGHGLGADLAHRYAVVGQAPAILESAGQKVRFVVADPSSYVYLTPLRPDTRGPSFAPADTAACPGVDDAPYGLDHLGPYARRLGRNTLRLRYPQRAVTVLLSGARRDDPFLDRSCAAQAQGQDRALRGQNYARHLVLSFGEQALTAQRFGLAPDVGGDNPAALWGSPQGFAALWGTPWPTVAPTGRR